MISRRAALAGLAAGLAAPALAQNRPRVLVVGGGFGGASAARMLARLGMDVTLVTDKPAHTSCPMSNAVIAGLRRAALQSFGYGGLRGAGVNVVVAEARAIDGAAKRLTLADGSTLDFNRAIVSPGIELRFEAVPGYSPAAADAMPHAWIAGAQTDLLRRQIAAMEDGGTFVMGVPANPYRCPPGPYERASLVAWMLSEKKPKSKLLILDSKDAFSKQKLFEEAWAKLYHGMIEWVGLSGGGKVMSVEPDTKTFVTEFGQHRADVANVIPPQRAAAIAQRSGLADRSGWCPVDPVTFESKLQPNVHVIGDAAIMGGMPKSAFAANGQAKVAAYAVVALLRGESPQEPRLVNTCYSLVAPDYGISIAGVYWPRNGLLADIDGAGGPSPLDAPLSVRRSEAVHAQEWFRTITHDAFG